MRGRMSLIIPTLGPFEDVPQDNLVTIHRHIRSMKNVEHSIPVSQFGIVQTQGMPRQTGGAQQLAQPLPIP